MIAIYGSLHQLFYFVRHIFMPLIFPYCLVSGVLCVMCFLLLFHCLVFFYLTTPIHTENHTNDDAHAWVSAKFVFTCVLYIDVHAIDSVGLCCVVCDMICFFHAVFSCFVLYVEFIRFVLVLFSLWCVICFVCCFACWFCVVCVWIFFFISFYTYIYTYRYGPHTHIGIHTNADIYIANHKNRKPQHVQEWIKTIVS